MSYPPSLTFKDLRPQTEIPRAGSERRARPTHRPHAQRFGSLPAGRSHISRDSFHLSRHFLPVSCGPPCPTHRFHGAVLATSPLLSVARAATRQLGAQWSPVLGTSPAGPQAPPCCAPPRLRLGERPPRGHVVPPSARAGVCERQRGCQVSPWWRVGVGGWAEGGPTGLRVGGTAGWGCRERRRTRCLRQRREVVGEPPRGYGGDLGPGEAARLPFVRTAF